MSHSEPKVNKPSSGSWFPMMWLIIPQDTSGDLALTPLTSKLCNWCSAICIVMAVWAHTFYEYAETRPAVKADEDPWMVWYLQMTANLAFGGFIYELCYAMNIKFLGLQGTYEGDLKLRRRLRLNRKMLYVFIFLTAIYHLMAFDYQYVHKGWLAEYHGGHQIVYSFRYIEWVNCAPFVLSISGQLEHAPDGTPRNGIIPSALLTGIYCIISWQGLVVKDFWAGWALITMAFISYFVASVEQLAFAWYLKDQGRQGLLRAGLLIYLVIMLGIYGVAYLLPIPGWISTTLENKFYCVGDISFKLGTSIMLAATNDLRTTQELTQRAETLEDDHARLISSASVPIFGVDCAGRINLLNQKAADLTGLPEEAVFNMPLCKMLASARRKDFEDTMSKALASGEAGTLEITLNPMDLEEFADKNFQLKTAKLVLSATQSMNRLGIMTGLIFIGYDLTAISAYQESDARKNRFMGVVSHELRSPLHGIIGLMDNLCGSEKDEMKLRRMKMISNCATRLLDLVINIMDVTSMLSQRSSKGSSKLCRDPVELPKIIEEIVTLARSSVDKRGKALVTRDMVLINEVQVMPIIEADAHKCTQVFFNLITNACKFTMKGSVTVSSKADPDGQWVEVSVADTGIGIAHGSLERIFEPFEQEDDSEARCQDGIGLGLSIAKQIVELHGGHIRVESEVGVGTTLTVHLPVVMSEPGKRTLPDVVSTQPMPRAATPDDSPNLVDDKSQGKPLVLSVDDDMTNQILIQDLLKEEYDIHIAMDGHEALGYLESCKVLPDVMLLDVMMPGMSGIEVCETVRQKLQINAITLPVLMVSASAVEETKVNAFKAGCNDYITKPWHKQELKARIQATLNINTLHCRSTE